MSDDNQSPTESVLRRIEGFAKDHHDSGYEQGYVDAFNKTQRVLARRSLAYLLSGLAFGGIIATLITVSVLRGDGPAPQDPIELGIDRGLELTAAANYARAYTVGVVAEAVGQFGAVVEQQSGSGFFYGDKGYVITNFHVIKGADRVSVDWNARIYEARVVGRDATRDIAILHIGAAASEVSGAKFVESDHEVQIAERVIAVGAPLGLDYSVTAGIISHTARRLRDFTGITYLQTDCSINKGNSGGPLVNQQGRVIGMNTKIASQSGDSAGIGFAIPARYIIETADALIKADKDPSLGEPSEGLAKETAYLGIKVLRAQGSAGLVVTMVIPGSPAERGGVRLDDIIRGVNGVAIYTQHELSAEIQQKYQPSDTIKLSIVRAGETIEISVTLDGISRR